MYSLPGKNDPNFRTYDGDMTLLGTYQTTRYHIKKDSNINPLSTKLYLSD